MSRAVLCRSILFVTLLAMSWALPCAVDAQPPARVIAVQRVFDRAAPRFPGHAAMTFVDLSSMQRAHVHGGEGFEAASLVKIGVLVELMHQVEDGRVSWSETMTLRAEDRTTGSGKVRDMAVGTALPVSRLATWMITISDNTATDLLVRRLGMGRVERRLQRLGLPATHLRRKMMDFAAIDRGLDNVTSSDDMARMLTLIADGRAATPSSCARMLDILCHQQRRHIIAAALPPGTRVASKTGELNGIVHDVAVVYAPHGPYVLALLGSHVSQVDAARRAFRDVSAQVYHAMAAAP